MKNENLKVKTTGTGTPNIARTALWLYFYAGRNTIK